MSGALMASQIGTSILSPLAGLSEPQAGDPASLLSLSLSDYL